MPTTTNRLPITTGTASIAPVAYLAWRYGKVNVNTATEGAFLRVLELAQAQASAIVEYRNHEGALRSMDDLRKVPGLDAADLGRKRDRIAFGDM